MDRCSYRKTHQRKAGLGEENGSDGCRHDQLQGLRWCTKQGRALDLERSQVESPVRSEKRAAMAWTGCGAHSWQGEQLKVAGSSAARRLCVGLGLEEAGGVLKARPWRHLQGPGSRPPVSPAARPFSPGALFPPCETRH